MKSIKFFPGLLLIGLVLGLFSCNEIELDKKVSKKEQPLDSREINILVDNTLNFSNYRAHTIIDSMAMNNPGEKLYGPKGGESTLFFTHNVSGEIMAMVLLDSASSEVAVNTEAVTLYVVTMAPMYTALSSHQKKELLREIKSEQPFIQLKITVEDILSKKEPIFSDRPDFIEQLLDINSYIMGAYYPELRLSSGRINLGKEDFPSFVVKDNGMTVINQVFSYVYLSFTPTSGGSPVSHVLDPRKEGKINRSALGLKDDCYTVDINQTDPGVITKNTLKLGTILTSAFLEAVIGIGIKGCGPELTAKITTKLGITLANAANFQPNDLLGEATKAVAEVIFAALKDGDCALLTNKAIIAKAVASKANLYGNLYKAVEFIHNASPAGPYALSLIPATRIQLSEIIQLYEGNLVEACVKVVKDVTLDDEYPVGKKITIKIKLDALSQYAEWKKSDFKVSWNLSPLNGELSQLFSNTNAEGVAWVDWTLPKEANAVVTLSAEVIDKEGDHLTGSPLIFQVKIKDGPEYGTFTDPRDGYAYKTVKIGSQTWFAENLRYAGHIPQMVSQQAWAAINNNSTGQPAWAYYNNDSKNNAVYGKLYNWYAVNTGTLCPQGWHIPTDAEWTTLTIFLGEEFFAGGKMKSVTGWDAPNTLATNESGFTGLPGGTRYSSGDFSYLGYFGFWWSSSPSDSGSAWARYLSSLDGRLHIAHGEWNWGASCRCLKD